MVSYADSGRVLSAFNFRNTFPPGKETFIPKVNFSANKFDFPGCHVDKSNYRTVRVTNSGDTPVKFSFLEPGNKSTMGIGGDVKLASEGGPAFSMKPLVGVLQPAESRLIVLRFSPSEQRMYDDAITCYFNSTETSRYELQMHGYGFFPQVSFESELNFKPTCIGAVAGREFTIRNNSKIDVMFEVPVAVTTVEYSKAICLSRFHLATV
jgi:cilia- and flagella-associated protein 65